MRGAYPDESNFSILFDIVIFCCAVVGKYVGYGFEEVKKCPLFVVRDGLLRVAAE